MCDNNKNIKISVYAIMKDEEQFYERWLSSMWDGGHGADEICVLDTGSKNGWDERFLGAANKIGIPKDVLKLKQEIYSPWRFDTPRNDSMRLISEDSDICICTDLDEILSSGWGDEIRRLVSENPKIGEIYYYYAWSSDKDSGEPKRYFWYNKCHRNPKHGVEWKYPVHETLTYTDDYKCKFPSKSYMDETKIWLWHYPDLTKSRGNYLGLLELRAQESPEDVYGLFYLAREYTFRAMWDKAIQWASYLLAKIKISRKDDMLMEPAIYVLLGECYEKIHADDECEFFYRIAIKNHPTYRDSYVRLAQKLAYSNRSEECFSILNEMEEKSVRVQDWRVQDYMWREWKIRQIRADALMWMGRWTEATNEMDAAILDVKTEEDQIEATKEGLYRDHQFLISALHKQAGQ